MSDALAGHRGPPESWNQRFRSGRARWRGKRRGTTKAPTATGRSAPFSRWRDSVPGSSGRWYGTAFKRGREKRPPRQVGGRFSYSSDDGRRQVVVIAPHIGILV